jgi:hypothetical protein
MVDGNSSTPLASPLTAAVTEQYYWQVGAQYDHSIIEGMHRAYVTRTLDLDRQKLQTFQVQ